MPSIFVHITSWHRATRSLTYDNFIVIQPSSHTHALSAFLSQPPRGTGQTSSTHLSLSPFFNATTGHPSPHSIGPQPIFSFSHHHVVRKKSSRHTALLVLDRIFFFLTPWHRAKVLNTPLYRSSTKFFSSRHFVAQSKSSQHTALFHATSRQRSKVINTLLYRPSTDFFFSRHLVAQSKSPQLTALPVLDRIFVFSTPPRGKEQKTSTHCSIGPRPNFLPFTRHFVVPSKSL